MLPSPIFKKGAVSQEDSRHPVGRLMNTIWTCEYVLSNEHWSIGECIDFVDVDEKGNN